VNVAREVQAERRRFRGRLGWLAFQHLRIPPDELWPRGDVAQLVDWVDWAPWTEPPALLPRPAERADRRPVRRWNRRSTILAGTLVDPVAYRIRTYGRWVDLRAWRELTEAELGWPSTWHWDRVNGYLHGRVRVVPDVVELPRNIVHHARPHLVPVGMDVDTLQSVPHDLERDPHGIWSGKTRSGKTTALILYCLHAVKAHHQALVIVDPDGQFRVFRDLAALPWESGECSGVVVTGYAPDATIGEDGTVSWLNAEQGDEPDLARVGAYRLRPIRRHLEAVEAEMNRRLQEIAALGIDETDDGLFADRRITVVLDETPSLFRADPVPRDARPGESARVRAGRMRNADREEIRALAAELVSRGGKCGISLIYGAQSARVEALGGGDMKINFGWRALVGRAGSSERRITFDDDIPPSPLGQGDVVAIRPSTVPGADEYLQLKGYLATHERLLAELAPYREPVAA
jgi:hypothetical protein